MISAKKFSIQLTVRISLRGIFIIKWFRLKIAVSKQELFFLKLKLQMLPVGVFCIFLFNYFVVLIIRIEKGYNNIGGQFTGIWHQIDFAKNNINCEQYKYTAADIRITEYLFHFIYQQFQHNTPPSPPVL